MYVLNKNEQKTLQNIIKNPYMHKTLELIHKFVDNNYEDKRISYKMVFDEIYQILNDAKQYVNEYLLQRKIKKK